MADEAPKTRKPRKAQGPRVAKPFHLLIRATDAEGNTIQLHKDRISIEVVKDASVLLELMTEGNMDGAVYKKFTPPSEAKPAA